MRLKEVDMHYAWPLGRIIGWSSNIYYLLVLTKTKLALNEKTQCNLQHSASCLRLNADTPRSHSTYLLMHNCTIHVIYHPFNWPIQTQTFLQENMRIR